MHCIEGYGDGEPDGRGGPHRAAPGAAAGGSTGGAWWAAPADRSPIAAPASRRRVVVALGATVTALAGCGTRVPAPAPSSPRSTASTPPAGARNWDEFRRNAGRRLVAMHPDGTYTGRVPDVLFGIPVLETELNADGSVRSIRVLRRPSDPAAADTVELAIAAVRRAAPYGDMTNLGRPWTWVEAFLFNDRRQFKPRVLD